MNQFKLQYEADIRQYASENILSGKVAVHFWEMGMEPCCINSADLDVDNKNAFIDKK